MHGNAQGSGRRMSASRSRGTRQEPQVGADPLHEHGRRAGGCHGGGGGEPGCSLSSRERRRRLAAADATDAARGVEGALGLQEMGRFAAVGGRECEWGVIDSPFFSAPSTAVTQCHTLMY